MQDDTVDRMWSSKESAGSNVTPRSLTDLDGVRSLPSNDHEILNSGIALRAFDGFRRSLILSSLG